MYILGRVIRNRYDVKEGFQPYVTIIIPTFNEQKVIAEKFKNLGQLSYAHDRLQVIIVDSGSIDMTYEFAKDCAKSAIFNCQVLKQEERLGKANAINFAMQYSVGEIVIVSDANSLFDSNSINEIIKPFVNREIGGAGGRFITVGSSTAGKGEEFYWSIEHNIRKAESWIYSMTNFSGEFNAFRSCFKLKLDERSLTEDLELTIQIIKRGYKVVYVPTAIVYEPAVENNNDLIVQKKRRAVGALQVIFSNLDLFKKSKLIIFNILFLFHRVLRHCAPIIGLTTSVLCIIYLSANYQNINYVYILFPLMIIFILLLIMDLILKIGFVSKFYYFMIVQYSYLLAWIDFITGKYKVTWEKTESSRDLSGIKDKLKQQK